MKRYMLYFISADLYWGYNRRWTVSPYEAHLFMSIGTARRFAKNSGLKTNEYEILEVEMK